MNRHSIFFRLNLLFALALVILVLLFVFFRHNTAMHEQRLEGQRGMELMRLLHHTKTAAKGERSALLAEAQFELLEPQQLPETARRLPFPEKAPRNLVPFVLYLDAGSYYFQSRIHDDTFLVRDGREVEKFSGLQLIFLLLLAGLITLYVTLRQSLLPLRTLTQSIRRFANGDHNVDTASTRRDEIALIANEFNDAVRTIGQLQSSRQLFLRNIMHELKTPLTKGKLTLAVMQESEQTRYLDTLFNRMNSLINRFAHIEKLQSSQLRKERRMVFSLLQEGIENLYLSPEQKERITIDARTEIEIEVDSELFVNALSNLIDNALKYADDGRVQICFDSNEICVSNHGTALSHPIEEYLQPFVSEHNQEGGHGLGLYIVKSLVEGHGFRLNYRYKNEMHHFCICFA